MWHLLDVKCDICNATVPVHVKSNQILIDKLISRKNLTATMACRILAMYTNQKLLSQLHCSAFILCSFHQCTKRIIRHHCSQQNGSVMNLMSRHRVHVYCESKVKIKLPVLSSGKSLGDTPLFFSVEGCVWEEWESASWWPLLPKLSWPLRGWGDLDRSRDVFELVVLSCEPHSSSCFIVRY